MKQVWETQFNRKFSINFYKNLHLKLAEMSFYKDFIHDRRGDPYPSMAVGEEHIAQGHYFASGAERYFCALFPYATYAATFITLDGAAGFGFHTPLGTARLLLDNCDGKLTLRFNDQQQPVAAHHFSAGLALMVTLRKNNFEVYLQSGDMPEFICEFHDARLAGIHREDTFRASSVSLISVGKAEVSRVESYLDSGLSQADIRPVKYENGDILLENGRVYFTLTLRMHEEMYQGVVSWIPGTAEFALTGAIFFNAGDGAWNSDVASSLKFDRTRGKWLLWVCSFANGHRLGYCESEGDFRFGINVADITLMPLADETNKLTDFVGFTGDEDPDFLYDEARDVWILAICRLTPNKETGKKQYGYYIFEGSSPFSYDRFVGCCTDGAETGGSLIRLNGQLCLVCGNGFHARAEYRVHVLPDMTRYETLKFDHDDGGFRGWGTLVPLKQGTRTRLYHLTFDRHNASEYNWSYGNLYCFEAN